MKKKKIFLIGLVLLVIIFLIIQLVSIFTVMFTKGDMVDTSTSQLSTNLLKEDSQENIVIRQGVKDSKQLTFSCNVDWGEEIIPDILAILRDNDIKITFFVSGRWAENHPDLLKDMYLAGHEIQSHGYSHKLCTQVSLDVVKEEILKTEAAILNVLNVKTTVFAPPSGDYDETTVELCKSLNYKLALWNADTIDWREGSTANVIKERIFKKDLNGAIILMHPKPETAKALPGLIEEIRERGLEIVPLYRLAL